MKPPKPKQKKAPWHRALHGDNPVAKVRKQVRKVSLRMAREKRLYNAEAGAWKEGRLCACAGIRDGLGRLLCRAKPHLCDHVHHKHGRLKPLLREQKYWVPVCALAHRYIEDNKLTAKMLGLTGKGPWNTAPRKEAA